MSERGIPAERLWRLMDAASRSLKKDGGRTVAEHGAQAESEYGAAYQALVQAGYAPQLRTRYRGLAGLLGSLAGH